MSETVAKPRGLRRLFGRAALDPAPPASLGPAAARTGPAERREPGFAPTTMPDAPHPQAHAAGSYPDDLASAEDFADGAWPDPEFDEAAGEEFAPYDSASGEHRASEDLDASAGYADEQAPDDDYARDPAWDMAPGTRRDLSPEGMLGVYNLGKAYKGRKVVHDVSINVRRGEAVGLLGPNGAGKTTVFYMITGLVKPDKGMIQLEGHDVTALPMYRRSRLGIGYLPQEASIFRGLNVEDNIRAVLEITVPDKKQRDRELDQLLDEFSITRLRKSPSIALSGGERRRCEIARALAGHPSFMLLDEPFAGIDPIAVGDIQDLVRHLKQRGIGVLITDHNVRETLGLIDRAYIIHSGHVLTEGTADEIVAHPDVRRLYLGQDFRM